MSLNKKGEITTEQLVTIIILIVSFVVILFFIFRLNLRTTTDKEICHNSVVMKSTTKGFIGKLNCKTNYVCISGGGKCEEISATTTVKVNPNSKEEIMGAIADEMADCWWMFGEGKMNYMKDVFLKNTACAICSIVDFDDKIESTYPNGITYKEFLDKLSNPMKQEEENYLYYIYGVSDVNSLLEKYPSMKEDYSGKSITLKGKFIIRTGNYRIQLHKVKEGFLVTKVGKRENFYLLFL